MNVCVSEMGQLRTMRGKKESGGVSGMSPIGAPPRNGDSQSSEIRKQRECKQ
jgi:hypothetical protein